MIIISGMKITVAMDIICKVLKNMDKYKTLKATRVKWYNTYRGTNIRMTNDLSAETM